MHDVKRNAQVFPSRNASAERMKGKELPRWRQKKLQIREKMLAIFLIV